MKKYVTVSLFIFWAVVVAVIVSGLVSRNNSQTINGTNIDSSGQTITSPGASPNNSKVFSMAEIAKHNSAQSCWLLISGKIYDVTTYLNLHPGNASTILPTCGTDATAAYDTKGSDGKPHSGNAHSLLGGYFIGNLGQGSSINSNPNANNLANSSTSLIQTPTTRPAQTSSGATLVLSKTELAKHNSAQSCWLLISGKIYDATNFLNQHPGNASTILPTCGTDATAAYASRGGTGAHSSSATAMLADYFIGNLDQSVVTNPSNPGSISVPSPSIPPRLGNDDDD